MVSFGVLSFISLLISAAGCILYALCFDNPTLVPIFVILAILSVILPPIAKKTALNGNKSGTWMALLALIIGGINFYFLIFAFTSSPLMIGYLGWVFSGIAYKLIR